ncbi:hypothetical protein ACC733_39075, partial [Rhizobium johnstonii]
RNLPAILAGLGLVVLWQVVILIFKIPTFMAPSPADVVLAFRDNAATLWRNFLPTLLEATLGFLFGNRTFQRISELV